jgi:hypothetical protein
MLCEPLESKGVAGRQVDTVVDAEPGVGPVSHLVD